jgi:hypothetical protein
VPGMAYAVGQTVEVCLEFDLPPARGIRRIVGVFENQQGQILELSDVPSGRRSASCRSPRRPPCRDARPAPAITSCGSYG